MRGGASVQAVGLLTGWGAGVAALPAHAPTAAGRRRVIPLAPPAPASERLRRATPECLHAIAAVQAMLDDAGLDRPAIRGSGTALVFVTAAAYGASNLAFAAAGRPGAGQGGATLHFPYTAPSAVAAEVTIEFGLTGAYVILIGGAAATVDALWQAAGHLASGRCERALVLAVETFAECETLWGRARRSLPGPLVESAACALLAPGQAPVAYRAQGAPEGPEAAAEARAGRTLAVGPLVQLALARAAGGGRVRLDGSWWGRTATVDVDVVAPPVAV
jgi:membrane protein implicated in regulation of membrane protease activity